MKTAQTFVSSMTCLKAAPGTPADSQDGLEASELANVEALAKQLAEKEAELKQAKKGVQDRDQTIAAKDQKLDETKAEIQKLKIDLEKAELRVSADSVHSECVAGNRKNTKPFTKRRVAGRAQCVALHEAMKNGDGCGR